MPYGYRRRKRYGAYRRKRSYGKKKYRSYKRFKRIKQVGTPDAMNFKLRYSDHYTHTHTSGAIQLWNFRANSVYDPDITYTGHSPQYFTEYSGLFQRYIVKAFKAEVTFTNLTAAVPVTCMIIPTAEDETETNNNDLIELPRCKSVMIAPVDSQGCTRTLKMYFKIKSIFGVPKLEPELDYSSTITTNPNQTAYFKIYTNSSNQGSTSSVAIQVKLTYYGKFYKRQQLT